jgi:hypothetical protein
MSRYQTYGMTVASELRLPELLPVHGPAAAPADVRIQIASFDRTMPENASGSGHLWAAPNVAMLGFEQVGHYLIRQGREIIIDADPRADEDTLRLFLLGPVLGALLHQRGFLVLHGSAAVVGSVAVGFVADKGTGKSTLAAAFCARGHAIVADDLLAVDLETEGGPTIYPGFPQLKLFPEAAAQLDACPEDLPRLAADLDKRARRITDSFAGGPLPLAGIYALCDGDKEELVRLSPHQAFLELVRHTFVLSMLHATGEQAAHFRQIVRLTGLMPVSTLKRRRNLALLPEIVDAVERDVASGQSAAAALK